MTAEKQLSKKELIKAYNDLSASYKAVVDELEETVIQMHEARREAEEYKALWYDCFRGL